MARYLIALGSSHSKGDYYIENALKKIKILRCTKIWGQSRIYLNNSLGSSYNSLFYNCVVAIEAHFAPLSFYRSLYAVEMELGRIRTYKFARRTIDLDLLLSLDISFKGDNFSLPHREAFKRMFFVVPAIEALQSAGWPVSPKLFMAKAALGHWYLRPLLVP